MIIKGFSLKDVTIIGRERHNLSDDWECFAIDSIDYPIIKYSMGMKNKDGMFIYRGSNEIHDTFDADEATVYSAARKVSDCMPWVRK